EEARTLIFTFAQCLDDGREFHDLDVLRAFRPVVAPAHDDVATVGRMSMVAKVTAFELELDFHSLPVVRSDLTLRLAIGVAGLNGFNHVPEFFGNHAEEEHHTLLVHRLVSQAAKVDRIAVCWAIIEFGMSTPW